MARIMVVDDVESDRLLEETILTQAGHTVFSSAGVEQALRRYLDGGIDLVITDLQMPDVHGFELISMLSELLPSPPVIAVSGTGEARLHLARQLGAVAILEKPIDGAQLLQSVEDALGT